MQHSVGILLNITILFSTSRGQATRLSMESRFRRMEADRDRHLSCRCSPESDAVWEVIHQRESGKQAFPPPRPRSVKGSGGRKRCSASKDGADARSSSANVHEICSPKWNVDIEKATLRNKFFNTSSLTNDIHISHLKKVFQKIQIAASPVLSCSLPCCLSMSRIRIHV